MGYFSTKYGAAETSTQTGGYFAKKYSSSPSPTVEPTQESIQPFKTNPKHKGITGWLSRTGAAIGNFMSSRTPLGSKPVQEQAKTTVETVSNAFEDTKRRFNLVHEAFSRNAPPLEKSGAIADAALGIVNLMFSPVSGELKGAEKLPKIGTLAKGVNFTFEKAAEYAGKYMDQVKRLTPDSPEKERVWKTLGPVGKEITGLAAQLALAKVGELAVKAPENYVKETNKAIDYLNRVRTTAAIEDGGYIARKYGAKPKVETPKISVPVAEPTPIESPLLAEARKYKSAEEFVKAQEPVYHGSPVPLKRFSNKKGGVFFTNEYADATGFAGGNENVYEGYVNFKKPLVIDAKGAKWDKLKTKFGTTTQEVISKAEKEGYDGVVFKNIVDNVMDTENVGGTSTISYAYKPADSFINSDQLTSIWEEAQKGSEQKTNGGTPSKIATSIEQKAVERKLTKGFQDVAEYEKINIADQAKQATDLVSRDLETARRVVRGEEPLPGNLRGTSLITAMEEVIKNTKDTTKAAELAYELANSRLITETSLAAQELRLAAERTPDSATAKLIEIKKARDAKVKDLPKRKLTEKKSLKKEMEKNNLTKEELSFNKFLDAITC